jgi:hypothetical protein
MQVRIRPFFDAVRIRQKFSFLLCRSKSRYCDLRTTGLHTLHGSIFSLHASVVSVHDSSWLHFEPPQSTSPDLNLIRIRIPLLTMMQVLIRIILGRRMQIRISFIFLFYLGKPAMHICHYPKCGKIYTKTSHLRAHLRSAKTLYSRKKI